MQGPFEKRHELFSTTTTSSVRKLILPVIHQDYDDVLRLVDSDKEKFVRDDLDVDGLNKVCEHLWFAGLPRCARPLHQQLIIGRKIFITERADLHLLWGDGLLFLKPLPDYLLSYEIWEGTLTKHRDLFEMAKGFLLSYLWLIRRKSDFIIAQRENLVNDDLTWEQWTAFSAAIFSKIDLNMLEGICPRYLYGELRLARVKLIYRLCRKTRNSRKFNYGYHVGDERYSDLITKNFAWVLTAILCVGTVLTAMQVGLATTELQDSVLFNRASSGFTIFSILASLGILLVVILLLLLIIVFDFLYTINRRLRRKLPAVFERVALRPQEP